MVDQKSTLSRWWVFGVVAAVALVFQIAGFAALGLPGGLVMAGVTLFLIGAGAAVVGHARWAFIASRRIGGLVAVLGVVALVAGTATAPPTDTASSAAEAPATSSSAAPTPDEAALQAAEDALAEQETGERQRAEGAGPPGGLADAAAEEAVAAAGRTTALAALAAIEVKGRAPRTGYARDLFGSGWVDTDRNGCDTRNDILRRDLTGVTAKPGTRECVILTGTLADPYSGRAIAFQRGQDTSNAVQIDHVVALSDAWQKGAQGLDVERRTAFANDPLNLLAVDGPLNMQKGDGDAATWLPPNRGFRCAYVARQVAVKVSYGLWMTLAERNAIATVLSSCPDEPLPGGVVANVPEPAPAPAPPPPAPAPAPRPAPAPAPAPVPAPAPAPAPVPAPAPAPGGVYYKNCDAARAANAAPVHRGDPGYASHLDRDNDGIGCE